MILGSYHYNERGVGRVPATTSGNEKTRISITYAASARGYKFKPIIINPRVNPIPDFTQPNNVLITYLKSGSFNEKVKQLLKLLIKLF